MVVVRQKDESGGLRDLKIGREDVVVKGREVDVLALRFHVVMVFVVVTVP